jgi:membrane-associated protein
MGFLKAALDLFLHFNTHLNTFAGAHPVGVYVLLIAIVFCETGLVIWPFLPGDSLLFALGALAATDGSPINLPLAIVLLCAAANCGDVVNYFVGRWLGPTLFSKQKSMLLNPKHLQQAHEFYERNGRKTIVLARFIPIVRTFAPLVAGIGRMEFARFIGFSIGGGILWVFSLSMAGYYFGRIPFVQKNFEVAVLGVIFISLIPPIVHVIQKKRQADAQAAAPAASSSVAAATPVAATPAE